MENWFDWSKAIARGSFKHAAELPSRFWAPLRWRWYDTWLAENAASWTPKFRLYLKPESSDNFLWLRIFICLDLWEGISVLAHRKYTICLNQKLLYLLSILASQISNRSLIFETQRWVSFSFSEHVIYNNARPLLEEFHTNATSW